MRAVVQRVSQARVTVDGTEVGSIGKGLLVLLGIARDDTEDDCRYVADKIVSLRIFDDDEGRMNLSLHEANGQLLLVSQFTLYGDVRRGRRPSWSDAAQPEQALVIYERFVEYARTIIPELETGTFRAMSQVELVNDGPVTILVDSRKQF